MQKLRKFAKRLEIYQGNAFIYRVYNYDQDTNIGEIEIITYDELIANYTFNPVTYKVTKNHSRIDRVFGD